MALHKTWLNSDNTDMLAYMRENLPPLQLSRLDAGYMPLAEASEICERHLARSLGAVVRNFTNRADTLTDRQYERLLAAMRVFFAHGSADNQWRVYGDEDLRSVYIDTRYGFACEISLDHDLPEV